MKKDTAAAFPRADGFITLKKTWKKPQIPVQGSYSWRIYFLILRYLISTLPKTNIAPEKGWFGDYFHFGFRGAFAVSFREGIHKKCGELLYGSLTSDINFRVESADDKNT